MSLSDGLNWIDNQTKKIKEGLLASSPFQKEGYGGILGPSIIDVTNEQETAATSGLAASIQGDLQKYATANEALQKKTNKYLNSVPETQGRNYNIFINKAVGHSDIKTTFVDKSQCVEVSSVIGSELKDAGEPFYSAYPNNFSSVIDANNACKLWAADAGVPNYAVGKSTNNSTYTCHVGSFSGTSAQYSVPQVAYIIASSNDATLGGLFLDGTIGVYNDDAKAVAEAKAEAEAKAAKAAAVEVEATAKAAEEAEEAAAKTAKAAANALATYKKVENERDAMYRNMAWGSGGRRAREDKEQEAKDTWKIFVAAYWAAEAAKTAAATAKTAAAAAKTAYSKSTGNSAVVPGQSIGSNPYNVQLMTGSGVPNGYAVCDKFIGGALVAQSVQASLGANCSANAGTPFNARYVTIWSNPANPDGYVQISQIAVYSYSNDKIINVAPGGTATNGWDNKGFGGASTALAIDGNLSVKTVANEVYRSSSGTPGTYWQLDLGQEYPVVQVTYYNWRGGGSRSNGATLVVQDSEKSKAVTHTLDSGDIQVFNIQNDNALPVAPPTAYTTPHLDNTGVSQTWGSSWLYAKSRGGRLGTWAELKAYIAANGNLSSLSSYDLWVAVTNGYKDQNDEIQIGNIGWDEGHKQGRSHVQYFGVFGWFTTPSGDAAYNKYVFWMGP
jgi:hypothetical protein